MPTVDTSLTSTSLDFIQRRFTVPNQNPYDEIEWTYRDVELRDKNGDVIFTRSNIEAPAFWSDRAVQVVAEKYFRGVDPEDNDTNGERSIRDMFERIVAWYVEQGDQQGYFASAAQKQTFRDELRYLLIHQMAAFNSPVMFNVGHVPNKGVPCPNPECRNEPEEFCFTCRGTGTSVGPQCAACFLNPVEDSLGSIYRLATIEGRLFSRGSGTGTNLSTLRAHGEKLSGGGYASGPVSFLRGYDSWAGVIRSGGATRRSAKMNILNADHPDIEEFIQCKVEEEKKAKALIKAGFDPSMNGPVYSSVRFQNENLSVWAPDEFMEAVKAGKTWDLKAVADGHTMKTVEAQDLMQSIAQAAWECADPGICFSTTINDWHTTPNCCGPINVSNPCGEFLQADGTACNLAHLNLLKFYDPVKREFQVEKYRHATRILFTAMDISISRSGYPSDLATKMANKHRPLGIGISNLGALIMAMGHSYDSDEGRRVGAYVYALMTGEAYRTSAKLAGHLSPYPCFSENQEDHINIVRKHSSYITEPFTKSQIHILKDIWSDAQKLGEKYGYRNSHISVAAPTGTTSLAMDCDTTGIEPMFSLVVMKKLAGKDGRLLLENRTVPAALKALGYSRQDIAEVVDYIRDRQTVEGCPIIKEEHMSVFDGAVEPPCYSCGGSGEDCLVCDGAGRGKRSIHYMGHVKMLEALTPFISGSISKTVNVPESITPDEILDIYQKAWEMGIKNIAVYRDKSKGVQALNVGSDKSEMSNKPKPGQPPIAPPRVRLPDENPNTLRKKFKVGQPGMEVKGFLHIGEYPDGSPGEIFLRVAKQGSALDGFAAALSIAVSIGLQHGIPLDQFVDQFSHMDFEPRGWTSCPTVKSCRSILDYVFRYLGEKYGGVSKEEMLEAILGDADPDSNGGNGQARLPQNRNGKWNNSTGEICPKCGSAMQRAGSCFACLQCAETTGCD